MKIKTHILKFYINYSRYQLFIAYIEFQKNESILRYTTVHAKR